MCVEVAPKETLISGQFCIFSPLMVKFRIGEMILSSGNNTLEQEQGKRLERNAIETREGERNAIETREGRGTRLKKTREGRGTRLIERLEGEGEENSVPVVSQCQ